MAGVSTAELRILITAQDQASQVLARAVGGFGGLAAAATRVGSAMSMAFTLPAAIIGGGIVKEAADLEETLNVLVNTTRDAGKNVTDAALGFDNAGTRMAAFRKEALALGADLHIPATSAEDAARAMDELSKAGLSVRDTLASARGTVQLAAAMQVDEAQAADLMSSALKAFNLSGSEGTHVANMFARATEISRAKFSDFTIAIRNGAAAFATTGRPLSEFLTMVGALVDRGVSGGVAATSLRRAVSAVVAPTAKASATMAQYGIALFDAEGKMKSWPDIIDNLNNSLGQLTPQETFKVIKNIFGQEGFKSIAPLLNAAKQGSDAMRELKDAFGAGEISEEVFDAKMKELEATGGKFSDQLRENIKDIEGSNAAELIAQARTKGLKGQLDGLWSSLQTVAANLGTPVLAPLGAFVHSVAEGTTALGAWLDQNPQIITMAVAFAGVVAAAGPLVYIFGRVLTLALAMATPFGAVVFGLATLAAAWSTDFNGIQQTTQFVMDDVRQRLDEVGKAWAFWAKDAGDAGGAVGNALSGINGVVLALQFALQGNLPAAFATLSIAGDNFAKAFDNAKIAVTSGLSAILNEIGKLTGIDITSVTGLTEKLGALVGIDVTGVTGTFNQLSLILTRIGQVSLTGLIDFLARLEGFTFSAPDLSMFDKLKELALFNFDKLVDVFGAISNVKINADLNLTPLEKLKEIASVDYTNIGAFFTRISTLNIPQDMPRNVENLAGALNNFVTAYNKLSTNKSLDLSAIFSVNIMASDLKLISTIVVGLTGTLDQLIGAFARIAIAAGLAAKAFSTFMSILANPRDTAGATKKIADLSTEIRDAAIATQTIAAEQAASRQRTKDSIDEYLAASKAEAAAAKSSQAIQAAVGKQVTETSQAIAEQAIAYADLNAARKAPTVAAPSAVGTAPSAVSVTSVEIPVQLKVPTADDIAQISGILQTEIAQAPIMGPTLDLSTWVPIVTEQSNNLIQTLLNQQPAMDEAASILAATVPDALAAAAPDVTSSLEGSVAAVAPTIEGAQSDAQAAGASLGESIIQGAQQSLDQLPDIALQASNAAADAAQSATPAAQDAGSTLGQSVIEGISQILSTVSGTAYAADLSQPIIDAVPDAQAAGTDVGLAATDGVAQGLTGIDASFAPVTLAVDTAMQDAQSSVQSNGQGIVASVTDVFAQVVEQVGTQMTAATAAVTAGGSAQQTAMETADQAILASATTSWQQIVTTVTSSEQQATAAVALGGTEMTTAMVSAGAAMTAAMTSSMANVVAAATAGATQAVAAVNAQVGPAGAAGAAVGSAIISGMSGAIAAGAGAVAAQAAAAVSGAIAAARAAADAHSPSKKTYQIGQDLIDGLTHALIDGKGGPAGALQSLVDDLIAQLGQVVDVETGIGELEQQLSDQRERNTRSDLSRSAEIRDALRSELILRSAIADLDLRTLPGRQALALTERQLTQVQAGSLQDRQKVLALRQQDNALQQQEIQLQQMLNQAQTGAAKDPKTGRVKDTQQVADIKAAIEGIKQQRDAIQLQTTAIKTQNEARGMGLEAQQLAQKDALQAGENEKFALTQKLEAINALDAAWKAHDEIIKNSNQQQVDDTQRAINSMKDQAAITPQVFQAGLDVLTKLRDAGALTQQEFEKFRNMLQSLAGATSSLGNTAPSVTTVGDAATVAGDQAQVATTKIDVATAGVKSLGDAGAAAGQQLGIQGAKGLEDFTAAAGNAASGAIIAIVNALQAQQGTVFNAGYAVGFAIGDGLSQGIIESGNVAINAAITVANAIIDALRGPQGFDAHSPARKSYYIGVDVMKGLQEGLLSTEFDNEVKQRIQDYIREAERYRNIIPQAADNEMKIINVRIAQAEGLLNMLDLDLRIADAKARVDDAQRGSLSDQLTLLGLAEQRDQIHMSELHTIQQINAAAREMADLQRIITDLQSGGLDGRLRSLSIEYDQARISRERIGIEQRLRAVQMTDLQSNLDRYYKEGLQVIDPNNPTQQEVNRLHNRLALLDLQNQSLDDESQLLKDNGTIAAYNYRVQLEYLQSAQNLLVVQTDSYKAQTEELQRQTDIITLANTLQSYAGHARVLMLDDEHRGQQRIIDDLDTQYTALNRQKQVYDAMLRAVDYLHDLLIDVGVIADPYANAGLQGTDAAKAAGSSRSAAASRSSATASRTAASSARSAASTTDALVGHAEAALSRLQPVVTAVSNAGVAGAQAVQTAATQVEQQVGRMLVTIGSIGTSTFRVSVDDRTIKESAADADALQTQAEIIGQTIYTVNVNGQEIIMSQGQAATLGTALQGVTEPVDIVVNNAAVSLSAADVATLQTDLTYLNDIRPTLTIEDQSVQDAANGVHVVQDALQTVDETVVEPLVNAAPLIEAAQLIVLPREMPVATQVDRTQLDAIIEEALALHPAEFASVVNKADLLAAIAEAAALHNLTIDDLLNREDLDQAINDAAANHNLTINDVVDRTEMDQAVVDAAQIHPLTVDDVLDRTEIDQAVTDAAMDHALNATTQVERSQLDDAIGVIEEPHTVDVAVSVDTSELDAALDTAKELADTIDSTGSGGGGGGGTQAKSKKKKKSGGGGGGGGGGGSSDNSNGGDNGGSDGGGDNNSGNGSDTNAATGILANAGQMYTVGEFGRELFVPWTKGYIMPHDLSEAVLDSKKARELLANGPGLTSIRMAGIDLPTSNSKQTTNNITVNYTAMEQERMGYARVNQVLEDAMMHAGMS